MDFFFDFFGYVYVLNISICVSDTFKVSWREYFVRFLGIDWWNKMRSNNGKFKGGDIGEFDI